MHTAFPRRASRASPFTHEHHSFPLEVSATAAWGRQIIALADVATPQSRRPYRRSRIHARGR
jgi:hypothetical protein